MWRDFVRDYFTFTSKERKGTLVIMSVILIVAISPSFFTFFVTEKKYDQREFEAAIASLKKKNPDADSSRENNYRSDKNYFDEYSLSATANREIVKREEFYFDPNSASAGEWKRLGVRDKTVHTIQNYISKGGRFDKPEDLEKVWGISASDKKRLIPYVRIKKTEPLYPAREKIADANKAVNSPKAFTMVDINLADTNAYISLPGIGSKLSKRIIAFRERLGGFYSIDQVGETYLLPDSTFQLIKKRLILGDSPIKKININIASIDEMKSHPYLRYNIANAIFQYRQQHGTYKSVEELRKIVALSDDDYIKVSPYLTVE